MEISNSRKHPSCSTRAPRLFRRLAVLCAVCFSFVAVAQKTTTTMILPQIGPYNANLLSGGLGLRYAVDAVDPVLRADTPWTISTWFKPSETATQREFLAGLGNTTSEYPRLLTLEPTGVSFWMGEGNELIASASITPGEWHFLSTTFDGKEVRLYSDGNLLATGTLTLGPATAVVQIAPPTISPITSQHFGGTIAAFTIVRRALTDVEEHQLYAARPDFAVLMYEDASKSWPVQSRSWSGYEAPQDPATMPIGRGPLSTPVAIQRPPAGPSLIEDRPGEWKMADGWTLREAPKVSATPQALTDPAFHANDWMRATVPGTVLTTMVDDGMYPDPAYGLNNLTIPETLNKQDYWYRNTFTLPTAMQAALDSKRHVLICFAGINYQAEIWLNGQLLGTMKGAFRRGQFDVTALLRSKQKNVLAVKISPPPHPGIPQEQSVLGGAGQNGGLMELDGPTFLATEGWDWIPAVRDRDSGLWQPVTMKVTGELRMGDVQILPTFHNHHFDEADVVIRVPVTNLSSAPTEATIAGSFDQVSVEKRVTLATGENMVVFTPAEFAQLHVAHPRLWWPNGYGKPELYKLHVTASVGQQTSTSDSRDFRFGMREISYELSLLDASGHLRRVLFTPGAALDTSTPIVDVSHQGMRQIPSADGAALDVSEDKRQEYTYHSVVSSLSPGAEKSAAIEPSDDLKTAPYLVIVVNGVRIAARGGNWGMDDFRKRVSREHLEPFFRLDRDAHLNIIRNWVGQNTEEAFYDLADEYGMLVWNDFWESTQNYNLEAEDPALFLDNARDTIEHFRNHPSVAVWCGRNEGVPQPILNAGLEQLVRTLDGTRFYSPSSNQVNLQQSGPYSYQDPASYATTLNRGFSVETGTPSMSTLESFRSTIPEADQWPIDDVWAYHDWHQTGNGRVAPFMDELTSEFGAPTSLADFERKAQMLNYVDHRAIFEGMNANLWSPNSGRLLWMTQPAWPSTMWQILSSDYDTQASFYGTKKACEPLHIQLNLATDQVDVVNTTVEPHTDLTATAKVYSLDNVLLFQTEKQVSVQADDKVEPMQLDLGPQLAHGTVIVTLALSDTHGTIVSRNLYWLAKRSAQYRDLNHLAKTSIRLQASTISTGSEYTTTIQLTNTGSVASLANKLTLLDQNGSRILPAYYSDNYISLLPGETQIIHVQYPVSAAGKKASVTIRGWNTVPDSVQLELGRVRATESTSDRGSLD
jgi:hypothetical protein